MNDCILKIVQMLEGVERMDPQEKIIENLKNDARGAIREFDDQTESINLNRNLETEIKEEFGESGIKITLSINISVETYEPDYYKNCLKKGGETLKN